MRGREDYLHLPDGVVRSKLTNDSFDSEPRHDEHRSELANRGQAFELT